MLLQQWVLKQQQVDLLLQQWEMPQQQVDMVLQQWEVTKASGSTSTAMGGFTDSKWSFSTAMGRNTTASDYGSLVIGQYNSSGSSATSADSFSTANTAFVIGNGADSSNISDAFSILFDGTTNIAGSVTATSFVGDGSQLTGITGSASSLNDLTDVLVDSNSSMFLGTPPTNSTGSYNTASGTNSLKDNTSGYRNTASGDSSLSSNTAGYNNTALGASSLGTNTTGNDNTASGYYSLYFNTSGESNTASGSNSLYFNTTGDYNTASGHNSLYANTIGQGNTASGLHSLSLNTTGNFNTASGGFSLNSNTEGNNNTALGYAAGGSSAEAINQTIIGYEATGVADNSVVLGNEDVTAVYMGEDSGATVYAAGLNIGGTEITSTATELNLLTGATSIGTGILSPVTENSNTGVRLSTALAANHGDIGSNAVDLSYSSSASTTRGATGDYSTAMGELTIASGSRSTATGYSTIASGYASTAMGYSTEASGVISTAMGQSTEASGTSSTAMGESTIASGVISTAMGGGTTASGNSSTAMGRDTEASGSYSTAMGRNTTASDYGSLVIGQYNSSGSSATSATSFSTANTAFVIGNGADSGLSDAFSILFDGTTNIAGSVTADSFIKDGGVSTEFLKADGSVDSSVYITAAEVTPQADSDWASTVSPTQILNKPTTISTQQADEITANTLKRSYPVLDEDKLATIETGAQVNVQSDWDATTGDALILNKPVIPTIVPQADSDWASTVSPTQILNKPTTISTQQADEITANTLKRSYPVLDEDKLATIETGAQVNVQSDWDATTGDALILNKPVIPTIVPQADSDWASTVSPTQILNKPTTISTQQADEITANTLKRSYPVLDEDKLATIETGAQVNVQSDWDATTGDALILNKPVIPTIVPQADSDWASTVSPTQILNKPTTISTQQADEITANTLKRSYPVLDEDKLATIETGAQVNVQSDWDATTGDALILNKPTDDQQLGNFILSAGSLLSLSIERGNGVSVNLAPLLADLEAENWIPILQTQ